MPMVCNAALLILTFLATCVAILLLYWWCLWVQSCFSLCGVTNEWLNVISQRATQSNSLLFYVPLIIHCLFQGKLSWKWSGFHLSYSSDLPLLKFEYLPRLLYTSLNSLCQDFPTWKSPQLFSGRQVYLIVISAATLQSNDFQRTLLF